VTCSTDTKGPFSNYVQRAAAVGFKQQYTAFRRWQF